MTNPTQDDRSTLVDTRVDAAWRETSGEGPSAALDSAILAAAHREVGAKPQAIEATAARRQWWPLAAAATVAAIAVGVLQLTPSEELGAPAAEKTIVSDVPAPAAKPAPASTPTIGPQFAPTSPPARETNAAGNAAAVATEVPRVDSRARRVATPPPAAATKSDAARQEVAVGQMASAPEPFPAETKVATAESTRPMASAPAASPAPAPLAKLATARAESASAEARIKDRPPLPVPEWIALIRKLHEEGKTAEAAKELAAFRAAHADHEKLLPPDLRDWRPPPTNESVR